MKTNSVYSSKNPLWEERDTLPFNELILSWNGIRPKQSTWIFWVSFHEGEWLKYAEWGPNSQQTFKSIGIFGYTDQDIAIPKEISTHFQIKVDGNELEQLHRLTVCLSNSAHFAPPMPQNLPPVFLQDVPRQSQMVLDHPRREGLCSPVSICTAAKHLFPAKQLDPLKFAQNVYDAGFDMYGNWILNIAESYHQTQSPCRVERLADFTALHAHLMRGKPVVVSVKGALAGALKPYDEGHLMCVIGYEGNKVYCIDSRFLSNDATYVAYELDDFLAAWGRRRNLAYTFW